MISIKNLHFAYGKTLVFEEVNTTLSSGAVYGILGRNGTGKSTLLYTIAGLLFPNRGTVDVMGFKPQQRLPAFLEEIFMIPEEFHLPDIPISKFVALNSTFYPKFSYIQFRRYLEEFQVPENQSLQSMSYGQKKKVLISFGLATNASLLLMDEPTNGLDIISKTQFRKLIASAVDEHKCFLISSHQVQDIENLIDHVIILDNTEILLQQSVHSVSEHLVFHTAASIEELEGALYAEPTLSGNSLVSVNHQGIESQVNLEMLYKATVAEPLKMKSLFAA
jgi:ABC-2 type transport system ATP-binding protein